MMLDGKINECPWSKRPNVKNTIRRVEALYKKILDKENGYFGLVGS
jgi:hypothetical protein